MSRRLLGALLLVLAGVGAVVGTFLPLYWQGSDESRVAPRFTTTSWRIRFENAPGGLDVDFVRSPQFGVPITVAAVLLAVAAALVFLPEAQRLAARYLAIAATGLLAGAVSATAAVATSEVDNGTVAGELTPFAVGIGGGVPLLAASVVVAVVGVVLVHARRAEPSPDGPVVYRVEDDVEGDDTDTPPFGIPVGGIEVAQIPETRYERPADMSDASDPGGKVT